MPHNRIGTLNETSLHADLRTWYEEQGDLTESFVDGYFIDIIRDDLLIEIQTGNFAKLKHKLNLLLVNHHVHLVYPIPLKKWIVYLDTTSNQISSRRLSPKKGRPEHVFYELVFIPDALVASNFSLELLLTYIEESRQNDGAGSWRRNGWSIRDRKLLDVVERTVYHSPEDFRSFLEPGLKEIFTSKDLALYRNIPTNLAQKMIYCLAKMHIIERVGQMGRHYTYTLK